MTYTCVSLFSGIGGIDLAFSRSGFNILAQVEIEPFCQKVLAKHAPEYWPDAVIYGDVHDVGRHNLPFRPTLLFGGVPCQPASYAGRRAGTADDRWLWPEALRIVKEIEPKVCFFENVPGLRTLDGGDSFREIVGSLAESGYVCEWFSLRASDVGAPHRRERIFLVAYAGRSERGTGDLGQIHDEGQHALFAVGGESTDRSTGGGQELAYDNGKSGRTRNDTRRKARNQVGTGGQGDMGNASNQGLSQPGQPRLASLETEDGTGLVVQPERPSVWARLDDSQIIRQHHGNDGQDERTSVGTQHAFASTGVCPDTRSSAVVNASGERLEGQRNGTFSDGEALAIAGNSGDGSVEPIMGRVSHGLSRQLDSTRWPARPGEAQYDWEAPRTATGIPQRTARIKALGNAVVPTVIEPIAQAIWDWLENQVEIDDLHTHGPRANSSVAENRRDVIP